jgi:two-component system CheB/CheR fusion protein
MPVLEAVDQLEVEPNHVYVIPPNRDMAILHRKLQLSAPAAPRGLRMPVDFFLRSLAEDQQKTRSESSSRAPAAMARWACARFSGRAACDLAQEPSSAKYDGMPSSAIKSGYVTHVLPAEKPCRRLLQACAAPRRAARNPPEPSWLAA